MALPTAPLGQLASLNMPYAIPTYEVRRGRDQVLTALATSIASALGQQAIQNATSRDYAETAGVGQNAGFWSKLFQGPTMGKEQFEASNKRKFESTQADLDRTIRSNIATTQADIDNRRIDAGRAESAADRELRSLLAGNELSAANKRWTDDAALRRELSKFEADNRLAAIDREGTIRGKLSSEEAAARRALATEVAGIEAKNALEKLREEYGLIAKSPQGRRYSAEAEIYELTAKDMRDKQRPRTVAETVSPEILAAVQKSRVPAKAREAVMTEAMQGLPQVIDPALVAPQNRTSLDTSGALLDYINARPAAVPLRRSEVVPAAAEAVTEPTVLTPPSTNQSAAIPAGYMLTPDGIVPVTPEMLSQSQGTGNAAALEQFLATKPIWRQKPSGSLYGSR